MNNILLLIFLLNLILILCDEEIELKLIFLNSGSKKYEIKKEENIKKIKINISLENINNFKILNLYFNLKEKIYIDFLNLNKNKII